ncbi:Arginine/ornithine antiporter ArcD [Minicystis rosea]|nr:Arginine/ornithine antiporter ArcD [Minicystis rosea]
MPSKGPRTEARRPRRRGETTMETSIPAPAEHATPTKSGSWAGRILSGLGAAFLIFDSAMKLALIEPVRASFPELGYPVSLARGIGLLQLICVAFYVLPRTAVLGAVLLTGYLGGAIATHVRIGNPLFSHVLFPVYVAAMLWGGLYLREPRLRALLPFRG